MATLEEIAKRIPATESFLRQASPTPQSDLRAQGNRLRGAPPNTAYSDAVAARTPPEPFADPAKLRALPGAGPAYAERVAASRATASATSRTTAHKGD